MTTIVLGAQWGDEGKGKLIDILCREADLCARCQGGNNAGHTIVANGTTYDFHILPSGLMSERCMNLIGSGVVVHVPSFFAELEQLARKGLKTQGRIVISDRAHVVFDLHQLVDGLEEVELGAAQIGTTKKGIGPAYSTKASRSGVRMADVFDEAVFERRLRALAEGYRKRYGDLLKYDVEEEIMRFKVGASGVSISLSLDGRLRHGRDHDSSSIRCLDCSGANGKTDVSCQTCRIHCRCYSSYSLGTEVRGQDLGGGRQRHHARS